VVLGKTGRNFAAGMSGGVAYVYDEDGHFGKRCNTSMVALDKVLPREEQSAVAPAGLHAQMTDEALLKKMIEDHHRWTGSLRAREILDHWATARAKFVKVFPHEYKRVLAERAAKAQASASTPKAQANAAVAGQ
jgi:glutamate synthase (NADPH) large chain